MRHSSVLQPVITEKSLALASDQNIYTFDVARTVHKGQIKDEVESLYGVQVVSVNTSRKYSVNKRTGRKRLKVIVAPRKKALVKLKQGQTVPVFENTQPA